MKNPLRLVLLVGLAAALANSAALALTGDQDVSVAHDPRDGVREFDRVFDRGDGSFPLPEPIDPNEPMGGLSGPVSIGKAGEGTSAVGGSAIVAPRGGIIASPKQQADQEIRRLIKKLR